MTSSGSCCDPTCIGTSQAAGGQKHTIALSVRCSPPSALPLGAAIGQPFVCGWWVSVMVLNKNVGPNTRLHSLGELPSRLLSSHPLPRTPLLVADLRHGVGVPDARLQHAVLRLVAAGGGGIPLDVFVPTLLSSSIGIP